MWPLGKLKHQMGNSSWEQHFPDKRDQTPIIEIRALIHEAQE